MRTETRRPLWQQRIEVAEHALAGSWHAFVALEYAVAGMSKDGDLLNTPQDASDMSYFLALLREQANPALEEGLVNGDLWDSLRPERQFDRVVVTISRWMRERRVPPESRCAVHNRIATVLTDNDRPTQAIEALMTADPVTPLEVAYTLAQAGVLTARLDWWKEARTSAEAAARIAGGADDSAVWLDVRMRAAHVLFRAEYKSIRGPVWRRVEDLARELEEVCGRQIDRWGSDHPRALEALVIMVEAQHARARDRRDTEAMERLTDVLAVAAQRCATLLGARHPQAEAARAVLEQAVRAEQHQQDRTSSQGPWPELVQRNQESWGNARDEANAARAGSSAGGDRRGDQYFFGDLVVMHGGLSNTGIIKNQAASTSRADAVHEAVEDLRRAVAELREWGPDHAQVLDDCLAALTADTAAPEDRRRALVKLADTAAALGSHGYPVVESVKRVLELLT